MSLEKFFLARFQGAPLGGIVGQGFEDALDTDKLAARIAPLLQPIGVKEARSILAGSGSNRIQESVAGIHGSVTPQSGKTSVRGWSARLFVAGAGADSSGSTAGPKSGCAK